MIFTGSLRQLVTTVFGPVLPDHGIDEEEIANARLRLGVALPGVLCGFYRFVGRHKDVSQGMNQILGPGEIYIANDGLVFAEENQAQFFSAIRLGDLGSDDPAVVQGNQDESIWCAESDRLSEYLLTLICWQAVNALVASTHGLVSPEQLMLLKAELHCSSFGEPEKDTFGLWGDGVAACVFTKTQEMYMAGRSVADLDRFRNRFGV
jgi:hypothetical protein